MSLRRRRGEPRLGDPRDEESRTLNRETWVCSFKGHVIPAAYVARLRPEDAGLGMDLPGGRRLARCLRCDVWVEVPHPDKPGRDTLPPLSELQLPRRGAELREAVVLRIIALDRGFHSILFALIAAGLIFLELKLTALKGFADEIVRRFSSTAGETGQGGSRNAIVTELQKLLHLNPRAVEIFLITAVAYAIVEGVEAVGLWRERRWAEYLTAVATAGFLPFEIHEIIKRVTVIRVGALIINIAILVYLVWKKRLFGLRGGANELRHEEVDREKLFGPPSMSSSKSEGEPLSEGASA
ncbi:MAG TPA: DUF2127 domain-containing protein [Actinobacteria bacterium]|nr:DUF2127 domain-containing protein [Actinomycetota bacterium]HCP61353.1 DUF2127 domain-containing protein [Actinomycetota bacterium]